MFAAMCPGISGKDGVVIWSSVFAEKKHPEKMPLHYERHSVYFGQEISRGTHPDGKPSKWYFCNMLSGSAVRDGRPVLLVGENLATIKDMVKCETEEGIRVRWEE